MYGLFNYSLTQPISLIVSIIMCLGTSFIGFKLINNSRVGILFNKYNYKYFFSPFIGSYALIFLIYPFLYFGIFNKKIFIIISCIIFIFGLIFTFILIKTLISKKISKFYLNIKKFDLILVIIFFFTYFLISSSPITHADSLAYHVIGSIDVLNKGIFNNDVLQSKNILVSAGEVFIILGFALKTQEFGNIIQYTSLLSLIPIFLSIKNNDDKNIFIPLLGILSSFCVIFLISSPKPQMLHMIGSLFVFSFLFKNLNSGNEKNYNLIFFLLTSILVINIQAKFSFILGSILFIIYFVIFSIKKKFFKQYLLLLVIIFTILVLPSFIFRYVNFNTNIINLFLSPFPLNIDGFLEFQNGILHQRSYGVFPLWLIIPNELKNFSSVIGPFVFIIFLISKKNIINYKYYFLGLTAYFILAITLGQPSSRFVFDGFLCLVYLIFSCNFNFNKYFHIFFNLIRIQSILIILVVLLFAIRVFPGSLSSTEYEKIMERSANGYSLMTWANKVLPKNSIVLSTHDSISLLNFKAFNYYFLDFVDFKNQSSKLFVDRVISNNVNTVLFYGSYEGDNLLKAPYYMKLKNCLGKLIAKKKDVGRHVGRNPFQQGPLYDGWLFEFKLKKFPICLR